MARTRTKCWSYNAGERGKNWCRAFERKKGGTLFLEWREPIVDEEGIVVQDERGKTRYRRRRESLEDPRRPGISDEQHQRVLAHSPNWRFALTAELCRATMHRMNSVRQLRKEDVDLGTGRVRWRGEHDKTGRELVTPLTPEAIEADPERARRHALTLADPVRDGPEQARVA